MSPERHRCGSGWVYDDDRTQEETWVRLLVSIPASADRCWCFGCGLVLFRDPGWRPRYWTQPEIDAIQWQAAELAGFFEGP